MPNNREQIDDFLRAKLQDVQFDFNENHWADAERRLDEEDDKKRPFWFLFIAVVLLVGAGLTALTQQGNRNKTVAANQSQQSAAIQNNNIIKNTSTTLADTPTLNEYNVTQSQQSTQAGIDNRVNSNPNTSNTESKTTSTTPSRTAAFTKKGNNKPQNDDGKNNKAIKVAAKNLSENKTLATAKSLPATSNTETRTTIENLDKPTDVLALQTDGNTSSRNKSGAYLRDVLALQTDGNTSIKATAQNIIDKNIKAESIVGITPNKDKTLTNKTPDTKNATAEDGMAMLGNTRVYKTPEDYQRLNPRYVASLQHYTYTESTIPLDKPTSDSIRQEVENLPNAATNKNRQRDPKIYEQGPSTFFLFAGMASAKGYKGNLGKTPQWGLSPSLGLGYQATFSDKMSLYLSVYMSYISNLNIKETGAKVTYSFDKDSTLLSVTRKNLLQMHIPLQLSYKLLPRLSMTGGIGFNLGLNTVSIYEDVKQNTSENRFGYTDGLRFLDVNANFGYDYAVTQRLTLGIFYQQGFFDMTKNDYFNNKQKDINARGGLNLRYKFKK